MKTFNKLMGDVKAIKGLVDKYKPVVQDKAKEYKSIIKQDAETFKNKYGPQVKKLGQDVRKDFGL